MGVARDRTRWLKPSAQTVQDCRVVALPVRTMGRGTRVYIGRLSSRVRERDLDYEFGR